MKKYFVLLASFLLYISLGINYSWSVFAQELKTSYGFTMTESQYSFSLFQLSFPIVFFFGGRLLEKFGPIVSAFAGSLLFGGGFVLAGLLPLTSINLALTIGLISGMGLGLAYAAPIYASQKNFPDKKSIATGTTVAAFAISAVIFSFISEYIIKLGWHISKIFLVYGIFFIVFGCLASLGLWTKKENIKQLNKNIKFKQLIKSKTYWALTIALFSGLFAGLMVFSNIKSIGIQRGILPLTAAIGVPIIALSNAAGRISWGYIAHLITEEKAYKIALFSQALVLILGAFFIQAPLTFVIFASLAGFNYGSNLVLCPSLTSRIWGVEAFGRVYPFIFISNAFSGFVSPSIGGKISDITGDYFWALIIAGILCLIAFIVLRKLIPSVGNRNRKG
jgi:MFS transporter, OFA family, oxalate/formate antiporter